MDKRAQRRIAASGGRAAHAKGTAHRFTSEEARAAQAAARKGKLALDPNREQETESRAALEDPVTKVLTDACTYHGIRPARPFESVSDFAAYVMDVYPVFGNAQRTEQLRLLGEAVGEARLGRTGRVVDRLTAIKALAKPR
jgi:hypothetical protein